MKLSRFLTVPLVLLIPAGGSMYASSGATGPVTYSCLLENGLAVGQIQGSGTTYVAVNVSTNGNNPGSSSDQGVTYAEVSRGLYTSYPAAAGAACQFYWTNSDGTGGSMMLAAS